MHMEEIVRPAGRQLRELANDYSGWRFGVGGSGHWWAVRRNECLRALSREELEDKLRRHLESAE
jgi:hypothetical protein